MSRENEPEFGQFERHEINHNAIVTRHPSFGVISVHHVAGGDGVFFGSAVQNSNYIELTVDMAEHLRDIDLHTENIWPHGKRLIKVALTHVQLADMLFNSNRGCGTPCTIREYRDGPMLEVWRETRKSPPAATSSKKMYVDEFKTKMDDIAKDLEEARTLAAKHAEAKTVNKGDREKLSNLLDSVEAQIKNNLPWALEMFNEKVEEVTMHAKAEVEASFTSTITKLGLQELKLAPEKLLGFEPKE